MTAASLASAASTSAIAEAAETGLEAVVAQASRMASQLVPSVAAASSAIAASSSSGPG